MNIIHLRTLGAILVIHLVASARAASTDVEFWRDALQTDDLRLINNKVRASQGIKWPRIYSSARQNYAHPAEREQNAAYAGLAGRLSNAIEKIASRMEQATPLEVNEGISELLAARAWIAAAPSYRNFILVDTINRHVLVRQLELLRRGNPDIRAVVLSLNAFAQFQLKAEDWHNLLEEETARPNELKRVSPTPFGAAEQFRSLQETYFPATELMALHPPAEFKNTRLLAVRNFAPLAMRMIVLDYYLRSAIPALIDYLNKADSPTVTDSYEKIRAVMGKDILVPDSIGAQVLERRRAAAAVDELLREIKTGDIGRFIKIIN